MGGNVACGRGEPFTTICNLFSKVYFVTIYLSLKKQENCSPQKKKFSKYMAGVVVSEGMMNRESWGRLRWTTELDVEGASTGEVSLCCRGERGQLSVGAGSFPEPIALSSLPQWGTGSGGMAEGQGQ